MYSSIHTSAVRLVFLRRQGVSGRVREDLGRVQVKYAQAASRQRHPRGAHHGPVTLLSPQCRAQPPPPISKGTSTPRHRVWVVTTYSFPKRHRPEKLHQKLNFCRPQKRKKSGRKEPGESGTSLRCQYKRRRADRLASGCPQAPAPELSPSAQGPALQGDSQPHTGSHRPRD